MNSLNTQNIRFPDFYTVEKRRSVNFLCLSASILLFIGGGVIAYVLTTSQKEQAEAIILTLMGYSGLSLIRMLLYVGGAIKYDELSRELTPLEEMTNFPYISILVPAYNEALVIADVIKNYSVIDYPNFEIILVDDGSKDQTYENALKAAEKSEVDIKVFTKLNGGKASALNFALEKAKGDFVLCMDADSKLSPNTLRCGIRHFENNPNLAAVAGKVKVENTNSFIGRMQFLDYLYGHLQKKLLSNLKAVTIVPGPIGLFRKAAIEEIGGYEKENTTYAEDTELTLKLLTQYKDIVCEDGMISYTEAPDNYMDLYRQRYRWTRGIFQAVIKNAQRFLESSNQRDQLIFIYLIWEQVLFPLIDFTLFIVFLLCYFFSPVQETAIFLLLYIYAIDVIMTIMATRGEGNLIKWITQAVLSRLFYSNLLIVWKISAFYDEWIARGMTWDKLARKGFSTSVDV